MTLYIVFSNEIKHQYLIIRDIGPFRIIFPYNKLCCI